MKIGDLNEAIFEAERFIKKAKEARTRYTAEKWSAFWSCKEAAAAKRASMDLSRALVRVRREA